MDGSWVSAWAYCPHCGNQDFAFPNNSPLADFFCTSCSEEFELKSQKGKFGARVVDGAFKTKCERLAASNNPNLLLMNYDLKSLRSLTSSSCRSIFSFAKSSRSESRWPPLARDGSARIFCSIAFPSSGKIYIVQNSLIRPKELVLAEWQRTLFLRNELPERAAGCSTS